MAGNKLKYREVVFTKPAKILQVFRMINEYGKDAKSFADRKHKLLWREILSKSGYVQDGILYLPETISADKKFGNCTLITIEDEADVTPQQEWKMINGKYETGTNHCFNLHHSSGYEIFAFQNDPVELLLRWDYSAVGDPTRDKFTLTVLEENTPVEIKINGKLDTSRGRYYKEQFYVFDLLGVFDRCYLLEEKHAPVIKTVPSIRKIIDLLKPLW